MDELRIMHLIAEAIHMMADQIAENQEDENQAHEQPLNVASPPPSQLDPVHLEITVDRAVEDLRALLLWFVENTRWTPQATVKQIIAACDRGPVELIARV